MNNPYYKIGILVFGFVLMASALWFVFLRQPSAPENTGNQLTVDQILDNLSSGPELSVTRTPVREQPARVALESVTTEERWEDLLSSQARLFTEQYGTYTNQSDFSHITKLKPEMTSRLQNHVDAYIADIKADHPYTNGYYGVTTRALTHDLGLHTPKDNKVNIIVGTQRTESQGETKNTYNQYATVKMIYFGGEWLIDGLFWE